MKSLESKLLNVRWTRAYAKRRRTSDIKAGLCVKCHLHKDNISSSMCFLCDTTISLYSYIIKEVEKELLLEAYGGHCSCCGESNPLFLTADHVNNDGAIERKTFVGRGTPFYIKARREGYPSKYQLLCFNCNLGKSVNKGICPHNNGHTEL